MLQSFRDVWVLTGPTGSGKSEFALRLAEAWNGEIVAMDSMTLYRGMDIGTAKPNLSDRQRVRHHMLDVLEPNESANVAWWQHKAAAAVQDIRCRGKQPILCGGTPLYLKAIVSGLFDGPPANPAIRARLESQANAQGDRSLHDMLARVDPATARRVHVNDRRRVIRAMEVFELTGKSISALQQEWASQTTRAIGPVRWLDRPRSELYARIDYRVEAMIAAGWLDEVRRLESTGKGLSKEASQALGYREMLDYLRHGGDWAAAVERIKIRTRQFAKRQLTWFRALPVCKPLRISSAEYPDPRQWPDFA